MFRVAKPSILFKKISRECSLQLVAITRLESTQWSRLAGGASAKDGAGAPVEASKEKQQASNRKQPASTASTNDGEYYKNNKYSFYDTEADMRKYRLPTPVPRGMEHLAPKSQQQQQQSKPKQ
jgi:hypothetical protein